MATTIISKAEFDALPDSLKGKFTADGDKYSLVEDVEGLKRKNAELLAEKKRIADENAALAKFKAEYEASKSADEETKQREAGQFAELEKKLRARNAELETEKANEVNAIVQLLKRERLTNELIAKGVLPDRAKYALADIENEIELERGESGFALKGRNGSGDAGEFAKLIEGVKGKSPFFFAADTTAGSGASGSGNGGSSAKSMKRDAFLAMPPAEQSKFSLSGGTVED